MKTAIKYTLTVICSMLVILYTLPVHSKDLMQDLEDLKRLIGSASGRKVHLSYRNRPNRELDRIIKIASVKTGVEEEMIRSIIKQESNYQKYAVSPKGASGYMQLMPSTARDLNVRNIFDTYENIVGGSIYFSQMLERFNGSYRHALMAYNAGPNAIEKRQRPYESRVYARKVLKYYKGLKMRQGKDSL